jgi:hypothetical protein
VYAGSSSVHDEYDDSSDYTSDKVEQIKIPFIVTNANTVVIHSFDPFFHRWMMLKAGLSLSSTHIAAKFCTGMFSKGLSPKPREKLTAKFCLL